MSLGGKGRVRVTGLGGQGRVRVTRGAGGGGAVGSAPGRA